MYIEYCLWAQVAVLDIYIAYIGLFGTGYASFVHAGYAGYKETLPDFLKWRRVTRPPLVFRGLTGSQRTPGFWGVTYTGHCHESTIILEAVASQDLWI